MKEGGVGLEGDQVHTEYRFELGRTTFFFGREALIPTSRDGLPMTAKRIYVTLARNSTPARAFYRIPPNRVVELGAQLDF